MEMKEGYRKTRGSHVHTVKPPGPCRFEPGRNPEESKRVKHRITKGPSWGEDKTGHFAVTRNVGVLKGGEVGNTPAGRYRRRKRGEREVREGEKRTM